MWQRTRKAVRAWYRQLRQAWRERRFSPRELAWALALGIVLGVVPVIGVSTVMILGLCLLFRLPLAPALAISYLVYPLQFLFLYPYAYLGAEWFGWTTLAEAKATIQMAASLKWMALLSQAGTVVLQAVLAWIVTGIPLYYLLYGIFRWLLERYRRTDEAAPSTAEPKSA